ncbi:MAG: hypothetical protein IJ289_09705 [Clostridia bacterium]|nr:hypothetical protein [Clostridia bacterium]
MVKCRLKERADNKYTYEYIPEGDFSKDAGIIIVDTAAESVWVEKVSEDDYECHTTADELNNMRNAINEMRAENGEPPLTEEEFPTAIKGSMWHYYANHAIKKLCDLFNSGEVPTECIAAWY